MAKGKGKKGKGGRKNGKGKRPAKSVSLTNNQDMRPVVARRPRKAGPMNGIQTHHVRGVCSVTDPFCPASKNSKWPDGTSGNTLTEQFRGNLPVTVDAAGAAFTCYAAAAPFGAIGSTVVGSTATTGATYATYKANSMLATYGSAYRIVSFGCVIRCIASATQASGILTLGTAPAASVSTAYTLGQELYSEVTVKAIQPGMEMSWVSQPHGTGARDFVTQSTATSVVSDWTSLWLEVSGATPATSPLVVEWFINVEFQPLTSARALTAIAKTNPPKSTVAESATSSVHSTLGSFIEGGVRVVEEQIAKHAKDALTAFTNNPFDSLALLFG